MIRNEKTVSVRMVGTDPVINKWITEINLVNGLEFKGIFMDEKSYFKFLNYNQF